MLDETKYTNAVARVKTIESSMLGKDGIFRMLTSGDFDVAVKVFFDAGFGYSSSSQNKDYELLLKEEIHKTYKFLYDICPEKESIDIFKYRNDCHNIKTIIKSKKGNIDNDIFLGSGTIPLEKLISMYEERKFKGIPVNMEQAALEAIEILAKTNNPQKVDLLIDIACYKDMLNKAKEMKSEFLIDLVTKMIDISNFKTYSRLLNKDMPVPYIKEVMLKGGSITSANYTAIYNSGMEGLLSIVGCTDYTDICTKGEESIRNTGSSVMFEKMCEEYIYLILLPYKRKSFGLEPLIWYLFAKEKEIKNINIILMGKKNMMTEEKINERLRYYE